MQISNYIKRVLEDKSLTLKWLHQEMQSYDIESTTYEYFWNKVKKDKLSAYELIVIASILDINLNLFPAMFQLAYKKPLQAQNPIYEWVLSQSEVKEEDCIRVFAKDEDADAPYDIYHLISFSTKQDWLVAESFIYERRKKVYLRVKEKFSRLLSAFNHDFESFGELSSKETLQLISRIADSYAILFPEQVEEEYPLKQAYSNSLKEMYMKGNSEFRGKGEQIGYFNVKKSFKDLAGKDVLVTLNLDDEFFAVEWFDFDMMEVRTLVKSESMFAGEPLAQEQDDFASYNKDEILRSLYDEYADYRLNVISDEEYDKEYPIRTIYTKGGYTMKFEDVIAIDGWEAWCTGTSDIPAKNMTLKDGAEGCVIVNSEGVAIYSKTLKTVNNDDIGAYFIVLAETVEEVDAKLDSYLAEEQRKEIKEVFSNYLRYEESYAFTK